MDEKLIEDILKHLDSETRMGVVRMSVEMDEKVLAEPGYRISAAICMGGRRMKRWDCWTAIRI